MHTEGHSYSVMRYRSARTAAARCLHKQMPRQGTSLQRPLKKILRGWAGKLGENYLNWKIVNDGRITLRKSVKVTENLSHKNSIKMQSLVDCFSHKTLK